MSAVETLLFYFFGEESVLIPSQILRCNLLSTLLLTH